MKQKILAELVKKFPGLSKEFLGFLAGKLEPKVTEESQIEGAITELDKVLPIKDLADSFQKEGDRRVTDAKKKFEEDHKKKEEEEVDDDDEKENPDDKDKKKKSKTSSSALAKFETELQKANARLDAFEKKEKQQKLDELLKTTATEKKIPLRYLRGRTLETEEKLEELMTEIEAEYTEDKQQLINEGYTGSGKPLGGSGGASKTASKEEIDSVVNEIM
jgi:hypothetical protein